MLHRAAQRVATSARETMHIETARERAGKKFLRKSSFERNHVAQTCRICTTTIQIFPELACVGFSREQGAETFLLREPLVFVQGGTRSEHT